VTQKHSLDALGENVELEIQQIDDLIRFPSRDSLKETINEWRSGGGTEGNEHAKEQQDDDDRTQPEFFVLLHHSEKLARQARLFPGSCLLKR